MNKPRGRKGGRKPKKEPAKNKRAAQIRESQKTFRAKQKARLLELEAKERELESVKVENAKLTAEKDILWSVVNSFSTNSLLNSLWSGFSESNNNSEGEDGSERNNIFDTLRTAKFTLKLEFFRRLYSVCGENLCGPTTLLNHEQSLPYLDKVVSRKHPITNERSPALSESLGLQEITSDTDSKNTVGLIGRDNKPMARIVSKSQWQMKEQINLFDDQRSVKSFNLLNASEIWDILEASLKFTTIDLVALSRTLKGVVFCLNFELVVELDTFVKILTTHISDERDV